MKNCPACKKKTQKYLFSAKGVTTHLKEQKKEKAVHVGKFISKKGVSYDKDDSLKRSQLILGVIAVFNLFPLVINYNILQTFDIVFTLSIVIIFMYCALTIKKHSFIKVLVPLIILILLNLLILLVNPQIFFDGIIIRAAYILALIYSLTIIRSHSNFKKKYED